MDRNKNFKVILPVWMTGDDDVNLTKNSIESVGSGHELIIIDNASTVGAGYLRSVADTYIRNKENLGYARAMNEGLKLCETEEPVAFIQTDTRVGPGWDKVALDILKDKTVGSVHFRMLHYDEPFSTGNDVWKTGKEKWAHIAVCVIRNMWMFDENYLNSYEDWHLGFQIRRAGFAQAYTNKVCFQHLDSYSQQKRPDRNENDVKNRAYFKQKWGDEPDVLFNKEFPEQVVVNYRPFP